MGDSNSLPAGNSSAGLLEKLRQVGEGPRVLPWYKGLESLVFSWVGDHSLLDPLCAVAAYASELLWSHRGNKHSTLNIWSLKVYCIMTEEWEVSEVHNTVGEEARRIPILCIFFISFYYCIYVSNWVSDCHGHTLLRRQYLIAFIMICRLLMSVLSCTMFPEH